MQLLKDLDRLDNRFNTIIDMERETIMEMIETIKSMDNFKIEVDEDDDDMMDFSQILLDAELIEYDYISCLELIDGKLYIDLLNNDYRIEVLYSVFVDIYSYHNIVNLVIYCINKGIIK